MRRSLAFLAAFLLAACSPDDAGNGAEAAGDDTNVAAPAPPIHAKALPEAFVGRWGIGPADCEAGRDDAKGLMTVTPTKLTFYESRASVTDLTIRKPDYVIADLDWSGEGMSWKTRTPLTVTQGGKALVRLDHETGRPILYARCPA